MSRFFFLLCLITGPLWADVNVKNQAVPLNVVGDAETAGATIFLIDNDDFANATPETPIYIRLTLDHGARLAETLVDYDDPGSGHTHQPIYLPLYTGAVNLQDAVIAAPRTTLAIVRWRAGENQIWLRISEPSTIWLSENGLQAPTPETPVYFALGIDAGVSDDHHVWILEDSDTFNANMPYATRATNGFGSATDTLLRVDLTFSNLEADAIPPLTELKMDPISFQFSVGVETAPTPGQIDDGSQQQINFSEAPVIGYGSAEAGALQGGGR